MKFVDKFKSLSYNNDTVRPWRNRQTRTFEGRMGDRVSSSLTGRTNKTSRNACLFFVRKWTCVVCNTTCYAQTHTTCIVTLHLCMQAYSFRYYGHKVSYKYTLARTQQDKQKCLSFFCAQVDLCGVQHHVLHTELTRPVS